MRDNIPIPSIHSDSRKPQPGMAECTITNKWFPEDELVKFQGQLVSAEGKQILLERLKTGISNPEAFACPTRWNRLWCICLDWLAITLCWYVGMLLVFLVRLLHLGFHSVTSQGMANFLILGMISVGYFAFTHGRKGKSIGKAAGDLRVITLDGSPISRSKAIARAVTYCGVIFAFVVVVLLMQVLHPTMIRLLCIGLLIFVCLAWGIVDIIFALTDPHTQRSLHDRICGTRVIKEDA